MELLLSLKEEVPESLWNQFKSSVQVHLKILLLLPRRVLLFWKTTTSETCTSIELEVMPIFLPACSLLLVSCRRTESRSCRCCPL